MIGLFNCSRMKFEAVVGFGFVLRTACEKWFNIGLLIFAVILQVFVLNAKEIGLAFHAQKTGFSFLTLNFSKDNFRLFLNFISLSAMPFTVLLYFIFRHDQSYHSN